ncbi:SRPBCC family protein [Amycolatopsis sp. PS_44_ISF1]|uniref:SRPBCC family protein n=1 Tax=Amycolatopsis sp. PS_44_ISF1 TaxID=2974917 RepID=UPI0028E03AAB|nr:SRPBCC family protein [Amycolatopsis sp. PS_44_ISF1]MDT8913090.1 SRPBCC family protein [Amycolatopsis sp. PS_44_ISF1]
MTTDLYAPQIPDDLNIRFVENRIVIERPAQEVYDWVTTWANLPKWLPMASGTEVRRGTEGAPAELGDVLLETIAADLPDEKPKLYTVVARVPGKLWTVVGRDVLDDGTPAPAMHAIATFTTFDLGDGRTLFCRLFERLVPPAEPAGPHPVEDPARIQPGLELIKAHLEGAAR